MQSRCTPPPPKQPMATAALGSRTNEYANDVAINWWALYVIVRLRPQTIWGIIGASIMSNVLIENLDSEISVAVELTRGGRVSDTTFLSPGASCEFALGGGQSIVIVDDATGEAHEGERLAQAELANPVDEGTDVPVDETGVVEPDSFGRVDAQDVVAGKAELAPPPLAEPDQADTDAAPATEEFANPFNLEVK